MDLQEFKLFDIVQTGDGERAIIIEAHARVGQVGYGLCYEDGGEAWWFDNDDLIKLPGDGIALYIEWTNKNKNVMR